jgi:hypothetical protein
MTEAEWLAYNGIDRLLECVAGRVSDRKSRLFAAACCRRVWGLLPGPESRRAVEVATLFADGQAGLADLEATWGAAWAEGRSPAAYAARPEPAGHAWRAAQDAARAARSARSRAGSPNGSASRERQAPLLRDVFGNPFRPARLDPAWLRWGDCVVAKMARAIYDGGRFGDLPVLADALEEAGCTEGSVLGHCRRPGEHVKGCWVVDLLLGKE